MANPFVSEIRIVGFNFPPHGWALCNGQLLPIAQNTALFSLLGTTFGGNGTSTFGLPNLQGSAPLHFGQGPGLSAYALGQFSGATTVTLNSTQLPIHAHTPACFSTNPNPAPVLSPAGSVWAVAGARRGAANLYATTTDGTTMNSTAIGSTGGSAGVALPHNNLHPYLAITFVIALQGVFPARN